MGRKEKVMDKDNKTLYTLLIYTENMVGMLSQVTAVFTRRQVNIESINASASSIEGVHKYTITTWSTEEQMEIVTKQIEKKVDVIKADYYTDDQIFIREEALFKLSTPIVLKKPEISKIIRRANAQIIEVNPTFCTAMLSGLTKDILALYSALHDMDCILQYTRSGRIAITRSHTEGVNELITMRENRYKEK